PVVINSVSILQTKLSNREGHETVSRALRSLRRKSHKVLSAILVAAHVQAAANPHWLSSIQRCPRPSNDDSRGLSSRSAPATAWPCLPFWQDGYCLRATGGPLTRFTLRSTVTSSRSAILMKGMPLFIP